MFFKKPQKNDVVSKVHFVIPQAVQQARSKALDEAKKRQRMKPLNLNKDLAGYMEKHKFDKLDNKPLRKEFKFKITEE